MPPLFRGPKPMSLQQLMFRRAINRTTRAAQRCSGTARFGLGRPPQSHPNLIKHWKDGTPRIPWTFPTALDLWLGEPLTLRERAMMAMMASIMGKPDWQKKVFDEAICTKWRLEAVGDRDGEGEGPGFGSEFSGKMFEFCIAELRHNAKFFNNHGFAPVLDAQAVVYAGDGIVPEDVRVALQRTVARLEDVTEEEKDWHPGSDGKTLNLVHPSLYPLVYGRTRALVGQGDTTDQLNAHPWHSDIVAGPDETDLKSFEDWHIATGRRASGYSKKFQWLPSDIHFEEDGARIASYINNLHPDKHDGLYSTIERIIDKAIPMWNETLGSTVRDWRSPRIRIDDIATAEVAKRPRPPEENEEELSEDDRFELDSDWGEQIHAIVPPEPIGWEYRERYWKVSYSERSGPGPIDLRRQFAQSGLQVIVKLSNIHLTPDKPAYDGGSWHIEGQMNEHIVATALYYYDSENVSDSHLAFREPVDSEDLELLPFEQWSWDWVEEEFGMENQIPFIQHLGRVDTKEGRLLTFPNVLQHRIEPFELRDRTKNGHRKVLALFLVDPYVRIPSTSIIPPQQREWWNKGLASQVIGSEKTAQGFFEKHSDALMDLTEAKELRRELIAERSAWIEKDVNPRLQTSTNFCEH